MTWWTKRAEGWDVVHLADRPIARLMRPPDIVGGVVWEGDLFGSPRPLEEYAELLAERASALFALPPRDVLIVRDASGRPEVAVHRMHVYHPRWSVGLPGDPPWCPRRPGCDVSTALLLAWGAAPWGVSALTGRLAERRA